MKNVNMKINHKDYIGQKLVITLATVAQMIARRPMDKKICFSKSQFRFAFFLEYHKVSLHLIQHQK